MIMMLCPLFALCHTAGGQPREYAIAAEAGGQTIHAVIVSGGMNKLMNQERYWNDCAFLYRTLRNDYHLPKRCITLLVSDGGEPGDDQLRADGGGFTSSSADLDGDGERDVFIAATMQNLVNVMSTLGKSLTKDDHLFIFLMDHGGSEDYRTDSYLWLWNSEKLTDNILAQLLGLVDVASVNIVAGQCYSGGFIDNIAATGRIVSTACRGDELSWSCPDRLYDEFIYHWTCAIAGHDEAGCPVSADSNGDGRVSMAEAFDYASRHDRRDETPQFIAQPEELGHRWTFGGLLPPVNDGIAPAPFDAAMPHPTKHYDLGGRPAPASAASASGAAQGHKRRAVYINNGKKQLNR